MVGYHSSRFGGHKRYGSGDIIILVCHVILQDTSSKGHVRVWAEAHKSKLPCCQAWWA